MAMLKIGHVTIAHPSVTRSQWSKIRTAAKASAEVSENLISRASDIFQKPFDPKNYLLTHATIVASVDTYSPPNTKLGSQVVDGFKINRKYPNYRVKIGCDQYINNNFDCWDRDTLLKSYKTFIGGHNYVEHVQVEELSKGRIIDAVARDLGDTVYVDILIATDRAHTELVEAIESGKMTTLSMGCTVDGTICTKCGHWAADETETCPHVRYEKGTPFFDEMGRQHRVAELCGHASLDPTGGVQFIEGSWVGVPAFTGAVMRNILEVTPELEARVAAVLSTPPPEWSSSSRRKAAGLSGFLAGWGDDEGMDEGGGEGDAPAAPEEPKGPFQDLEDELSTHLKDKVLRKLKKDMDEVDVSEALSPETPTGTNDTIVKQGHENLQMMDLVLPSMRKAYERDVAFVCRVASNHADLMNRVASLNPVYGVDIPVGMYRAAVRLGSLSGYRTYPEYIRACHAALGRQPSHADVATLIRLGKIISRQGQVCRESRSDSLAVATRRE